MSVLFDNPADIASRGTTANSLISMDLWWYGPDWLHPSTDKWPLQGGQTSFKLPELKSSALIIKIPPENREPVVSKFSSYLTLLNVCAWIFRFTANAKKEKQNRVLSPLTLDEVLQAEEVLFKQHQSTFFSKETDLLHTGSKIPPSSSLHCLHPFMDEKGIVRVGKRLRHSALPYSQKHPVILCRHSHLVLILVKHLHRRNQHAGPSLLLSLLSRDYYIPGARSLVRKISRSCVTCQKEYARSATQLMGDLPSAKDWYRLCWTNHPQERPHS